MKKFAILIVIALSFAGPALADPLEGIWQTSQDDNGNFGQIAVTVCGTAFCGVLVRAYDATGKQIDSPNIGKQIIWDMAPFGDGRYGNGKVWSPDRDKTYNSKIVLSGDRLTVKGCVFGICRDGGTWARVQ